MVIGTCSICGGRVEVPDAWHGVIAPAPTCSSCGAIAAQNGPVIPMRPVSPVKFETTSTSGTYDAL